MAPPDCATWANAVQVPSGDGVSPRRTKNTAGMLAVHESPPQSTASVASKTRDTKLPDGRRVADQEWVQLNLARVHAKLEFVKLINWKVAAAGGANPADSSATKVFATEFYTEAYRLLPFRSPAAYEVFDYADGQRDMRLKDPQDDVINALTVAQSEGILNEQEFHNYFGVLMIAGNETTRHTISHGMLALMEHPDQRKLLQEEPERIPRATEEILRWATPVHHFRRTATRDVELRGVEINRGDKVVTWYIAAVGWLYHWLHDCPRFGDTTPPWSATERMMSGLFGLSHSFW